MKYWLIWSMAWLMEKIIGAIEFPAFCLFHVMVIKIISNDLQMHLSKTAYISYDYQMTIRANKLCRKFIELSLPVIIVKLLLFFCRWPLLARHSWYFSTIYKYTFLSAFNQKSVNKNVLVLFSIGCAYYHKTIKYSSVPISISITFCAFY